jgi:hypothetical protein
MSAAGAFLLLAIVYFATFAVVVAAVILMLAGVEWLIDAGARRGWWHRRI